MCAGVARNNVLRRRVIQFEITSSSLEIIVSRPETTDFQKNFYSLVTSIFVKRDGRKSRNHSSMVQTKKYLLDEVWVTRMNFTAPVSDHPKFHRQLINVHDQYKI